jgi:DNA-binding FrmR family transcriptional regulator
MRNYIKTSCKERLSRIEGQVRGLSKMVDEEHYCIDIVTQISAVPAGVAPGRRGGSEGPRRPLRRTRDRERRQIGPAEKIAELMAVIGRADR